MTEATLTLGEAQEPTPPVEAATNEHDVAIAETEAAAEIAVAEINADAREAEAERIADAIETAGERTEQEELQWLRERVAFLEGQQASPPILTETTDGTTLLIPLNSSAEAETTEPMTDPAELTEAETPPPLSDASQTDDPESAAPADPEPDQPAPVRRKRRMLI